MKRILFLLFVIITPFLYYSCQDEKDSSILVEGKLLDSEADQQFIVQKVLPGKTLIVDTVRVDSSGNYQFKLPATDYPVLYKVEVRSWLTCHFVADNQDLNIKFSTNTRTGIFQIKGGSKFTQTYKKLVFDKKRTYFYTQQKAVKKLHQAEKEVEDNEKKLKKAQKEYDTTVKNIRANINKDLNKIVTRLAERKSLLAPVAFTAVYQVETSKNISFLKQLADNFKEYTPDNPYTKGIVKSVNTVRSIAVGQPFKNFTVKNIKGKKIKFKEIVKSNKYTLLEFWASWCGPCRVEIPNMKKAYTDFENKGFEIFSVSLDQNKEMWKKVVKEENGLPWINTGDMRAFKSPVADKYAVVAIPKNFLINTEGIIIARNLRGENLKRKLEEFL